MALPEHERAVFTDLYRYYEKYAARAMTVQDFCDAAEEWAGLVHKHDNTLLAKDMFAAVYEHLGNRSQRASRDAHGGDNA
jgi:hypothetical protein